jgi:hypothetical protein
MKNKLMMLSLMAICTIIACQCKENTPEGCQDCKDYGTALQGKWLIDTIDYKADITLPNTNPPLTVAATGSDPNATDYVQFSLSDSMAYYKVSFITQEVALPGAPPIPPSLIEVADTGKWSIAIKNEIKVTNKAGKVVSFTALKNTAARQIWKCNLIYDQVPAFGAIPVEMRIVANKQ